MSEPLLKCAKCGAVLVNEGYHLYGWYLDGNRMEGGCPPEPVLVQVGRDDLKNLLAAIEEAGPALAQKEEYQRLLTALGGK
jgi:hypothetical protein